MDIKLVDGTVLPIYEYKTPYCEAREGAGRHLKGDGYITVDLRNDRKVDKSFRRLWTSCGWFDGYWGCDYKYCEWSDDTPECEYKNLMQCTLTADDRADFIKQFTNMSDAFQIEGINSDMAFEHGKSVDYITKTYIFTNETVSVPEQTIYYHVDTSDGDAYIYFYRDRSLMKLAEDIDELYHNRSYSNNGKGSFTCAGFPEDKLRTLDSIDPQLVYPESDEEKKIAKLVQEYKESKCK